MKEKIALSPWLVLLHRGSGGPNYIYALDGFVYSLDNSGPHSFILLGGKKVKGKRLEKSAWRYNSKWRYSHSSNEEGVANVGIKPQRMEDIHGLVAYKKKVEEHLARLESKINTIASQVRDYCRENGIDRLIGSQSGRLYGRKSTGNGKARELTVRDNEINMDWVRIDPLPELIPEEELLRGVREATEASKTELVDQYLLLSGRISAWFMCLNWLRALIKDAVSFYLEEKALPSPQIIEVNDIVFFAQKQGEAWNIERIDKPGFVTLKEGER